jgi:hypothetical protein
MMSTFEWLGLILVFILGFAEGMITPSAFFRLLTMLVIPFAIGLPFFADPFGLVRLMLFVPCAMAATGFGSLLGEGCRQRIARRAQSSPPTFQASFFKPSPCPTADDSGTFDGRHCVACRAPLKAAMDFCPKCGWTQPTRPSSAGGDPDKRSFL